MRCACRSTVGMLAVPCRPPLAPPLRARGLVSAPARGLAVAAVACTARRSAAKKGHFAVYIEDTDCFGVVFYANYFRFFQRALNEKRQGFIVGASEVRYRSAAKLGDDLEVSLTLQQARFAASSLG